MAVRVAGVGQQVKTQENEPQLASVFLGQMQAYFRLVQRRKPWEDAMQGTIFLLVFTIFLFSLLQRTRSHGMLSHALRKDAQIGGI